MEIMGAPTRFEFIGDWQEPLIATAIHAGNQLRPDVAAALVLADDVRFREEDPFTELIAQRASDSRVIVHRSRFETDLNRPRSGAVYRTPDDAWGLQLWRTDELAEDIAAESLTGHDLFYAELAARLDRLAEAGPFVVYDVHSYNHRRDGAAAPASPASENPEVNVGTGTLPAACAPVAQAFIEALRTQQVAGHQLDVRENVRFQGGYLSQWIHQRYPGRGCALALEFKKTFMDEWTGIADHDHIDQLAAALAATRGPVLQALAGLPTTDEPR